jgi:hypothetical protein
MLVIMGCPHQPRGVMQLRHLIISSAIAGSLTAPAQSVWTQLSPPQNPGTRFGHAMAFDAVRGLVMLYGGNSTPSTFLGDLWSWNGSNWQQVAQGAVTPGTRTGHAMCFHAGRGQILLVGGHRGASEIMDTWGFNGTSWQQVLSSAGSLVQAPQSLAYDPIRNVVVAFDGNRTCEWNGIGGWVQRTSAQAPATGDCGAMAFDAAAGQVVLFTYDQTWSYDGTNWTRRLPANSPPARTSTSMAYDSGMGQTVLFGGYTSSPLDDTWVWNGSNWARQIAANPPPARDAPGLAYDSVRQRIVMYGGWPGFADTWIKNPTFGAPATMTPFGSGCPGSVATPTLGTFAGSLPWIGGNWIVQLQSLPPLIFNAPFGIFGLSNTNWSSLPLPLDLGIVGMPGCNAYVSVDDVAALVNNFGTARWTIPVPNNAGLVGMHVYLQGMVVDPRVNSFGAVVSNAADCVIGAH